MPKLQAKIAETIADLTYPSESDAPVNYFELPAKAKPQWPARNAAEFLAWLGKDPKTPIEELDVKVFFERWRQSYEAPVEKLQALEQAITQLLTEVRGYRVGRIEVDLYVLGLEEGRVCGIHTLSVET